MLYGNDTPIIVKRISTFFKTRWSTNKALGSHNYQNRQPSLFPDWCKIMTELIQFSSINPSRIRCSTNRHFQTILRYKSISITEMYLHRLKSVRQSISVLGEIQQLDYNCF